MYILGIDQSTQGTKALIYGEDGRIIARSDRPHRQIVDERGWVEHDPKEIINNVLAVVKDVTARAQIDKGDIAGVGISNQRETAVMWDKKTGRPLYNAIVWQCARGEAICRRLESKGWADKVKDATGLNLSPYFSAAKLAWIVENIEGVKEKAKADEICCGTMDSWIVYQLTGSFKTDYSNASRTQLFNINTLKWDEDICRAFGLYTYNMPEVCDSNAIYGYTDFGGFLPKKIPVHAVMGDSHAALFGQFCHAPGEMKSTYGTGSSIMMNVGEKPIRSEKGLVSSIAWGFDGRVKYVLEGNINYTGAVITWLKDDMQLIKSPAETQELAEAANTADKTYLVPAFTGLGAPYWDSSATALLTGMTRTTGRKEIVRAAVNSIAYQIADVVNLMRSESGLAVKAMRADGGPTKNAYLMQFQSDILNIPVQVSQTEELSACGAAYMAGISMGLYSLDSLAEIVSRKSYQCKMDEQKRQKFLDGWKTAVDQVLMCGNHKR